MAQSNKKGGGPQKGKSAANAIVTSVAVIATLILANLIATRFPRRLDLTEDHVYKLSKVSVELMKKLPDRMNAKLVVSTDLPPQFKQVATYVADLLDEYRLVSDGKFDFERIDPITGTEDERKKKMEDLRAWGIQKMAVQTFSEGKVELGTENYLGVAFIYGDKTETIKSVVQMEALEYQFTTAIKKLTDPKKRKIGFVTSEGELSPERGLQVLSQRMGQDYETSAVQLDKPVADDIDALFICGPKQPFSEKGKYYLDQFLMKGKSVALFLDGMKIEAPQGMNIPGMEQPKLGQPNDVALNEMLEKYGVKVRDDIVHDMRNVPGVVPFQGRLALKNDPVFVAVTKDGLPGDHPVTEGVGAVVLPFPSTIELVGDLKDGKGGVKAKALATSSAKSWRNSGFFIFNPEQERKMPDGPNDKGPFALAYALEGKFQTAFPGGMPGGDPGTTDPEGGASTALKESPEGTRFVIVSTSKMLDDQELQVVAQYVPAYVQGIYLAQNAADWLAKDDSLMALRAKGVKQRPLIAPVDSQAKLWKWFIQAGVPALMVGAGLLLWVLRSARRRASTLESLGA